MKTTLKMKTTSKNEDDLNNEDDLKNEDDIKNEDDLKMKTISKIGPPLKICFAPLPPLTKLTEFFFDEFSP